MISGTFKAGNLFIPVQIGDTYPQGSWELTEDFTGTLNELKARIIQGIGAKHLTPEETYERKHTQS